jgi:hypothetical protein
VPFIEQPPSSVIDAYMAELKSSGINGKRENIEHDIDGLIFAYSQHQMAEQATAELVSEGNLSADLAEAASERYKLDPRVKIILDIALKHFAKYLK